MTTLQRAPTRTVHTAIMDSAQWADFPARPDDIVIATYSKCGTTWTQRIVDLLVFQDPAPRPVFQMSVWVDARIFAPHEVNLANLEAQTHRRFVKSHLPFDALPVFEGVKYIHVARDGRDAFMSWHNHRLGQTAEFGQRVGAIIASDPALQGGPPLAPVPEDPHEFFQSWIAEAEVDPDASVPHGLSYFDFENTYWSERKRENLLFVHYNDLKADLVGEMRRISEFLEIDTPQDRLPVLAAAAQFDSMKKDGAALMPGIEQAFDRGADRFLNKGTNGRWKDALTAEDLARYDAAARRKLSPSLAAWLENGRLVAGDPKALPD
jgi:aryl sulfotransferase